VSFFLVDAAREWRDSHRQVLLIAHELGHKGYDAHIVGEPGSDLVQTAAADGLSVLPLKMSGRVAWWARRGLARHMKAHGCKLIHFHDTLGAGLGLAAAVAAEVPLRVLTCPTDSSPLEGRLSFAAIDAVIAGSEGVRSILVRGGVPEERITVVPLGTDFSRFTSATADDAFRRALGSGPDDFLVGVVVPLEDERGHEALLDAAALVAGQAPRVRFVVLGEGSLRLEAPGPETARPMDNVRYHLGFRADTPRVLASLNMFTVFSHLDGLGGQIVEAMAAGLAVAAADVGRARDLITHRENGLLVPARNARSLADAVLKVHFDKNLAGRLAVKGRESVLERYSAEAMARRVIGVYEWRAHRKGLKLS
jgi:glycosyltransferase involved in cell wall biosynthesis